MRCILTIRCCAVVLGLPLADARGSEAPILSRDREGAVVEVAQKKPVNTSIANRPVIVAFGDSLTAGYGAEPGNSYPDFLQKDLDRDGFAWRVVNAGVSGDTTTDGLNRLNEVLAAKPRIAIVEFGGNDGLRGLPIETTRANLEQIVLALRNAHIRVLLAGMTLPPNYGRAYINSFEQIYVDLAGQYKLARIPFLLQDIVADRNFRTLIQRDGIHPTGPGNAIVAETVMKYLRTLLRQ
jgi:acyl-CoA thioesterase-1